MRINEIAEDLNPYRNAHLLYHSVFIFRRLFFVFTVFVLDGHQYIQIILFILANLFYLIFLLLGKPLLHCR